MKTLLACFAVMLTLLAGFASAPLAEPAAGYSWNDYARYPGDGGFGPHHWPRHSAVMLRDPYVLRHPGPVYRAPAVQRYDWGSPAYPTDEGFPPNHWYGPSIVMHPWSHHGYPPPWQYAPVWGR
ncbi:hypothetical protein [uncultured Thiohalocapsa sp.]|uniref:hypothetical protein n=1 Tax=uncultured Thiohalocapsa sp. TaxID=768990 RepID=UPI0025E5A38E|nr:hypothetical protein [uncultured Thiohalocapsa sp.]